jgi:hypothetical protein
MLAKFLFLITNCYHNSYKTVIFIKLADNEFFGCMCATKADVGKLDNPVWPNPNYQARTELCTQGGNKLRGAKGMANCRP